MYHYIYDINFGDNDYQTGQKAACIEHKCPELNCDRVVQEKGKCCKSCDTSGNYHNIIMKYTNVFYCSVCFSDQLFLAPDKKITTCKINGSEYEDLSLVPTSNISDPCEVCHCRVSVCKLCNYIV